MTLFVHSDNIEIFFLNDLPDDCFVTSSIIFIQNKKSLKTATNMETKNAKMFRSIKKLESICKR